MTWKEATWEAPFSLVYGTEIVIPREARLPTLTTLIAKNVEENKRKLARNVDMLEKIRECVQIKRATYQHKSISYYNKRANV